MDANTRSQMRMLGRLTAHNIALRALILAEAARSGAPSAWLTSAKEQALRAVADSEKLSSGELWDEFSEAAYTTLAGLYELDVGEG